MAFEVQMTLLGQLVLLARIQTREREMVIGLFLQQKKTVVILVVNGGVPELFLMPEAFNDLMFSSSDLI